jgi:hypothetical protein
MKYFTMDEMTRSDTARRYGINNTPNAEQKQNIRNLVDILLDPIRTAWGGPIRVNSGYRCSRLNALVGGVRGSQHTKGEAADIEVLSRNKADNKRLFNMIRSMNLPFDQLINEYDYDWIHISYTPRGRHKVLEGKKVGGKTVYTEMK